MIAVRRNHRSFGRGTLRFLYPRNRKVLAYLRELGDESILCVANLSRAPQAVELDLSDYKGRMPVEMTGGTPFPLIGESACLLTLPAYGFYWFSLSAAPVEQVPGPAPELFTLVLQGAPDSVLKGRERAAFERTAAPSFLPGQRWFQGKNVPIRAVALLDHALMKDRTGRDAFPLPRISVELKDGSRQNYFLPLAVEPSETETLLPHAVALVRRANRVGMLCDAAASPEFALATVSAIARGETLPTSDGGAIRFSATNRLADAMQAQTVQEGNEPRRLGAEQSNSSIAIGERAVLKIYRRLQPGIHPEIEIGRYLTDVAGFANTPALLGTVEHVAEDGTPTALAVLQGFVRNQGDAWTRTLETFKRELENVAFVQQEGGAQPPEETFGVYLRYAEILGRRTAELHRALATPSGDSAFAIEPLSQGDLAAVADDAKTQAERGFVALERLAPKAAEATRPTIEALLGHRQNCIGLIDRLSKGPVEAVKCRVHGDFHLGQVLIVQDDLVFTDFEGEPSRPAEERRVKSSPLRDVAGILRSIAYAADTAARDVGSRMVEAAPRVAAAAAVWQRMASDAFLEAYQGGAAGSPIWVEDATTRSRLLRLHLLGKALYEINYEADNRPDWIETPVRGLLSILNRQGEGA
jgi:maltose alpha-D-glucosyltransferase/alpha-amylase